MLKIKKYSMSTVNLSKDIFHRKIKTHWKKIIITIMLVLFIVLIGFIVILNMYLNKIDITENDLKLDENIQKQENTTMQNEENTFKENNDIKNIALFGIDETDGIAGRSDLIMILTFDNKHKKLKLSSILRDSYVLIPTKENKSKINHAYAFGGPQLALQTLNTNFNLNLTQFVAVNFSSLPKIIDCIGGITLDITDDELKYINGYIKNLNNLNNTSSLNITKSGIQKVDGTQALAYCRIRYTDGGDFERSQRHRTVINQLIEISKTIPLTQYPSLLDELLPLIHTNLKKSDILFLAINLNSLKMHPLLQDRFPKDEDGTGQNLNGIYYYVFNKESTIKKIHDFIFENNN